MEIPKACDWVKARSECSLSQMFLLLAEVVDSDVKSIQSVNHNWKFTFNKPSATKILVGKHRNTSGFEDGDAVIFELTEKGIVAKSGRQNMRLFTARPSLNERGECQLEIDGISGKLELWQVSRQALEPLFFDE